MSAFNVSNHKQNSHRQSQRLTQWDWRSCRWSRPLYSSSTCGWGNTLDITQFCSLSLCTKDLWILWTLTNCLTTEMVTGEKKTRNFLCLCVSVMQIITFQGENFTRLCFPPSIIFSVYPPCRCTRPWILQPGQNQQKTREQKHTMLCSVCVLTRGVQKISSSSSRREMTWALQKHLSHQNCCDTQHVQYILLFLDFASE